MKYFENKTNKKKKHLTNDPSHSKNLKKLNRPMTWKNEMAKLEFRKEIKLWG